MDFGRSATNPGMNKTYTPNLDSNVMSRLAQYAAQFEGDFARSTQARWTEAYLRGLLQDGERKSVEPLVGRIELPAECQVDDPVQAVRHFVGHAPWDTQAVLRRYRRILAGMFASPLGIFVFDDTSWPKQGTHSVGVQRQYCGALGKKSNCQVAPSIQYVAPNGHFPLALRLYLPKSWIADPARLDEAKVPPEFRTHKTKPQIALELLDEVRSEGIP